MPKAKSAVAPTKARREGNAGAPKAKRAFKAKRASKPKITPKLKHAAALKIAREAYGKAGSWIDFYNALFGHGGVLVDLFKTPKARKAFVESAEFKKLTALKRDLPTPPPSDYSGRFNLRVPKSIHEALAVEAEAEGVSLNQLCVAKLSASLRETVTQ